MIPTIDTAESIRAMHLEYQRILGQFVLNRLKEVTLPGGGVVGYTLNLNMAETEQLMRLIDL